MAARLLTLLLAFLTLGQTTLGAYVDQTNPGGNLYLVNRTYLLDSEYVPPDLVKPDVLCKSGDITIRREPAAALKDMFDAAKAEHGFMLQAVSGYRAYNTQSAIYKRKIDSTGSQSKAQRLVAPPGASEHQLGLAMDIGRKSNTNLNKSFGASEEGKWVAENAHRFGFIIRYKEGWSDITGYAYEPWHVRYVGREHAARIHQLDIPLESYVDQLRTALRAGFPVEGSSL